MRPDTERMLTEIEVRLHGPDAVRRYSDAAESCKSLGDDAGEQRNLRAAKMAEEILEAEKLDRERQAKANPQTTSLYGAVAGISLAADEFQLGDGVALRTVYAHVMAPYILAFAKAERGKPHPGPWKAASGGIGFDVYIEIVLPEGVKPTSFDRLNTIWWILSLLRLHHATGVRVPVISDTSFGEAAKAEQEPAFWTLEMSPNRFRFDDPATAPTISPSVLEWLRAHYKDSAAMMTDSGFGLAYMALDGAHGASEPGSAMLLIWSALEALFRPSRQNTTHKLSAAIATYLEADPAKRDTLYQKVRALYSARGQITHAAEKPTAPDVLASFAMARRCFTRALELRSVPDFSQLLSAWSART